MYYKFTDVNGRFYLPLTPIVEPACPHARGWTGDANPTRRQLEPRLCVSHFVIKYLFRLVTAATKLATFLLVLLLLLVRQT